MDSSNNFAGFLSQHRTTKALSQSKLAEASGVHDTLISRLESGGRQPTLTVLRALTDAMGSTEDERAQLWVEARATLCQQSILHALINAIGDTEDARERLWLQVRTLL